MLSEYMYRNKGHLQSNMQKMLCATGSITFIDLIVVSPSPNDMCSRKTGTLIACNNSIFLILLVL